VNPGFFNLFKEKVNRRKLECQFV